MRGDPKKLKKRQADKLLKLAMDERRRPSMRRWGWSDLLPVSRRWASRSLALLSSMLTMASHRSLTASSSVGKWPRALVTFRSRALMDSMVILSFRVSQGCDLRRPVVDSVADGTLAA